MKLPRLNLRDLFWLILVAAMGCGWWLSNSRFKVFHPDEFDLRLIVLRCLLSAPLWVPILFAAYAMGRGKLTRNTLIAFFASELAAFGVHAGLYEFVRRVAY